MRNKRQIKVRIWDKQTKLFEHKKEEIQKKRKKNRRKTKIRVKQVSTKKK